MPALTTPAAIGVVGAAGLYGRWLMDLFGGLYPEAEVIGIDADGDSTAKTEFVAKYGHVIPPRPVQPPALCHCLPRVARTWKNPPPCG